MRTAATGDEALRGLRHAVPDAVSLDLMLPDIDGLEVCRRRRADARTAAVPVIMVKPFSPKGVLARVRRVATVRSVGNRFEAD